jgi:hypothetical protein
VNTSASHTKQELEAIIQRLLNANSVELDSRLPEWARRSNPIVRRQLGAFWKLMIIDADSIARLLIINIGVVLLSLIFPFILVFLIPVATVSVVLIPFLLVMHGRSLLNIAGNAAGSIVEEKRNNSLDLLLICPRPLRMIIYSKGAAAVWRDIENIGFVLTGASLLSLPLLIIQADTLYPLTENSLMMRVSLLVLMVSSVIRIPLEAALASALGLAAGSMTRYRIPAKLAGMVLIAAYLLAVNSLRLLVISTEWHLFITALLPLIAPPVLMWVCVRITEWRLRQE